MRETGGRQPMRKTHILTLSCEDRPGLVADVAGFLANDGCHIRDSHQFNDIETNLLFIRIDRKRVVSGKSVSDRVDLGGGLRIQRTISSHTHIYLKNTSIYIVKKNH